MTHFKRKLKYEQLFSNKFYENVVFSKEKMINKILETEHFFQK